MNTKKMEELTSVFCREDFCILCFCALNHQHVEVP